MSKILLSPQEYKTMYQLIKQHSHRKQISTHSGQSAVCIDICTSKDITKNISLIFRNVFKSSYIEDITRRREDMTFIFEW